MKLKVWRMHRKLDDRVAEARQRARKAEAELTLSRVRARAAEETVIVPMRKRGEEHEFAAMLRKSLYTGWNGQ